MTWDKYKERISRQRKEKWRKDETYRNAQAERDRTRRDRLRKEALDGKRGIYKARLLAMLEGKGKHRPHVIQLGGRDELALTTGGLAEVVDRTVVRVQQWLREKLLPGSSKQVGNRRYFIIEYVELICDSLFETELQNARGDSALFKDLVSAKIAERRMEVANAEKTSQVEREAASRGPAQDGECNASRKEGVGYAPSE